VAASPSELPGEGRVCTSRILVSHDVAVTEKDQFDRAERVTHVLSRLDGCDVTVLALLDALSMSGLKLVDDKGDDAGDAYRHAVEEIRGE
jgi:hypothetical protein